MKMKVEVKVKVGVNVRERVWVGRFEILWFFEIRSGSLFLGYFIFDIIY